MTEQLEDVYCQGQYSYFGISLVTEHILMLEIELFASTEAFLATVKYAITLEPNCKVKSKEGLFTRFVLLALLGGIFSFKNNWYLTVMDCKLKGFLCFIFILVSSHMEFI